MGIFRLNGVVGKRVPNAFQLAVQQAQDINLKAVKTLVVAYDPFDERSIASRKFLEILNLKSVTRKFPDFTAKVQIKCDRSEPTISFDLGKKVLFKGGNLTTLEMFELYNKHITPHAPVEETQRETLSTKAMRKGAKK